VADVDDWQWRQMILSPYGPPSPAARLVALTINAYMTGEKPYAYPSQSTVAQRVQLSVRQTGRVIKQLIADGWIDTMRKRRDGGGHNWKMTVYFPAVPDHLAEHVPERPWKSDRSFKRRDKAMSGPQREDVAVSSAPAETVKDRTSAPLGQDISGQKDRTFSAEDRTSGCPTMSSSEGFKDVIREGASGTALAETREPEKPKSLPISRISKPRAHRSLSDTAWLRKMIEHEQPVDAIASASASSPEEVRRAIEDLDRTTSPTLTSNATTLPF